LKSRERRREFGKGKGIEAPNADGEKHQDTGTGEAVQFWGKLEGRRMPAVE